MKWLIALMLVGGVAFAEPRKVTVGVYVNHVYGVDMKQNQFNVDFYVWFRWDGGPDEYKPLESFELANGRITSKSGISKKQFGTQSYVSVRVVATVQKFWDLRRYPLDDHTLAIEIEDSDQDTRNAIFVADTENAAISPDLQVPGWAVGAFRSHTATHSYATNYGDITIEKGKQATYSRYVFEIEVERPGYGRFVKVFFGLFVSTLISFCSFFVRPKESSPRVSLGVGATFAAAAVTVAINNSLPDTNAVTMADKLIMLSLGTIVLTLVNTIVALRLVAHDKDVLRQKIDHICSIVFPVLYLGLLVVIVV